MPKFTPDQQKEASFRFDLETAVFELLNNWWLIIIGSLIVAMISYVAVTEMYDADYTSEATFAITVKGSVTTDLFSDLNTTTSLAESFKSVLQSEVLREKACEALGIQSFPGVVSTEILPETNILTLRVTSNSPSLTFRMINAIVDNHHAISDSVLANATMELLLNPEVPRSPSHNMRRRNTVISYAVVSALAISGCIVAYSSMNDKVKNERDLVERIDCSRLATFYHEESRRTVRSILKHVKKKSLLVNSPTTSFRYSETFRLLRSRIEYLMEKGHYKVLMVGSVLNEEGRTTIAANIALMLAQNGKRVLLIEGDMIEPSMEKKFGMDVDPQFAIENYLVKPLPIDMLPKMDGVMNLSVLICKQPLKNSSSLINSQNMQEFIRTARQYYDYVIIDTPPLSYPNDAENLAEFSDAAVMAVKQNTTSARRLNDAIEVLENNNVEVLGCILNDIKHISVFESVSSSTGGGYHAYKRSGYGSRKGGYGYGYYYDYSKNDEGKDKGNSFRAAESENEEVNN